MSEPSKIRKAGRLGVQLSFIAGCTLLAWFSISAAIIAICATILVVLAGKLESIVELSFGPLRAKLERNLSKSEQLLDNLKRFAAIQGKAAIAANVYNGRFGSDDDRVLQSVRSVEQGLRELGFDENEIAGVRSDFVRLTIRDAAGSALGSPNIPSKETNDTIAEWKSLHHSSDPDPDVVEEFLCRHGQNEPERLRLIEDMRWMRDHKDVRDTEQYLRARKSIKWSGK